MDDKYKIKRDKSEKYKHNLIIISPYKALASLEKVGL